LAGRQWCVSEARGRFRTPWEQVLPDRLLGFLVFDCVSCRNGTAQRVYQNGKNDEKNGIRETYIFYH